MLDGFIESVRDEPKHAAHFTQEIATDMADPLHDHDRVGRQGFVLCGHIHEKLPYFGKRTKCKQTAQSVSHLHHLCCIPAVPAAVSHFGRSFLKVVIPKPRGRSRLPRDSIRFPCGNVFIVGRPTDHALINT